jgi:hypothetical protein
MRRFVLLIGAALAVVGPGAGTSTAAPAAEQVHIAINDTSQSDFWSEQCGFEVTSSLVADLQVTVIRNREGLIVREIDTYGGATFTFSSQNGSFAFPQAPLQVDYGSGAVVGSEAVISFTGMRGRVPGLPADAGLERLEGVVVAGFDEFGLPFLDFANAVAVLDAGSRHDFETVRAAICAALSSD